MSTLTIDASLHVKMNKRAHQWKYCEAVIYNKKNEEAEEVKKCLKFISVIGSMISDFLKEEKLLVARTNMFEFILNDSNDDTLDEISVNPLPCHVH